MKHTPAPWIFKKTEDTDLGGVVDGDGDYIMWFGDETEYEISAGSPPFQKDLNLILAAPELLEALNSVLNLYVQLVNSGDAGNWDVEKEPEIIKARKVIAKAAGES